MKDEIKVGDYIRTNDGIIGKVKRIEFDKVDISLKWYVFDRKRPDMNIVDEVYINKPYIVSYSSKIINLLEDEDFVILEYKSPRYKERIKRKFEISKIDEFIRFENAHCSFLYKEGDKEITDDMCKNIKILSIITHEQLRNIEYTI